MVSMSTLLKFFRACCLLECVQCTHYTLTFVFFKNIPAVFTEYCWDIVEYNSDTTTKYTEGLEWYGMVGRYFRKCVDLLYVSWLRCSLDANWKYANML